MKAVALISTGIDSPVAAYIMKKKGLEIIGLNLSSGDETAVKHICKKIGIKKLYTAFHTPILKEIKEKTDQDLICVLCKRMMYRIAEKIAKKEKASFIITGENLGQVASQTLDNLAVLSQATSLEILRPLLCFDKNEIIAIAKKIKTYELAQNIRCPFVPKHPATKASLERVQKQESKINIETAADAKPMQIK